ncbi:Chromatin-remodeling complex subunit ies6, partial [Leucoagaricus sp. SymC.cos]
PPKGGFKKKAAASDGTATPHIPSLAEQLSYLHLPKPFKNPNYTKNVNRRVKNLKTILGQERERERADREKRRQEKAKAEAQGPDKMEVYGEPTKSVASEQDEEVPTYISIEAPPSILPQKRYCDITGLEVYHSSLFLHLVPRAHDPSKAPYTDPATGLRYHDKRVYEIVKGLSASTAKEYLSARGVNSIVK